MAAVHGGETKDITHVTNTETGFTSSRQTRGGTLVLISDLMSLGASLGALGLPVWYLDDFQYLHIERELRHHLLSRRFPLPTWRS